ncbi:MAG: ROK family protein [Clostridia bacterium]|nr:ROK family protein [Clostridia bacterium]
MIKIGVDLGGTNTAAGIVDGSGAKLSAKVSVPTKRGDENEIVESIVSAVEGLLLTARAEVGDVMSIGLASPGIVNREEGIVEFASNLPLRDFPLAAAVSERLSIDRERVHMVNDAAAAAIGEYFAGAGRGTRDFIVMTLGTGIGGGIIVDGHLLTGHNHAGGEIGHTVIVEGGEPCGCGRRGCAEAYCSVTGLIRMTKESIDKCGKSSVPTLMTDIAAEAGKIGGRTAFDAMRAGDAAGTVVVERYITYLAAAVTNYINIFQPEVFAVGGGISNEGDTLIVPLREKVYAEMYNRSQPRALFCEIKRAELGNDAGIFGAALAENV